MAFQFPLPIMSSRAFDTAVSGHQNACVTYKKLKPHLWQWFN